MAYNNPTAGKQRTTTPAAAIVSLTVSVGTTGNTVADVGAAFSQTTLNNNFRVVADKINTILTTLKNRGITL